MIRDIVRWLTCVTAVLLLAAAGTSPARAADDPVEDLRRILAISESLTGGNEALDFRRSKIQDAIDRMNHIGQYRRALVLDEWKVDPVRVVNDNIRNLDIEMRKLIGDRMKAALEKMAANKNGTARLASANVIAEMGPTVRATDPADKGGYTRGLTSLVAKLCNDPDVGVRQEALRALGNINGPPSDVASVFRQILQKDTAVGPRRLAADGLNQMIKVAQHLQKRGQIATGVEADQKDLINVLQAVAPAASVGAADSDWEVRMLSLNAIQTAAQALAELLEIPEGSGRRNFPTAGRRLTAEERARIIDAYKSAETNLALVKPMFDAFKKEIPVYAKDLHDSDPRVRLAAIRAFENLGNARLRLVRRANSLPTLTDTKGNVERSPQEMLKEADFLSPFIANDLPQVEVLLRDPDVRIRRAAAESLEVLEDKALPAMNGLIASLRDPDRFVRWTAAKTLGYMPPASAGPAVQPLGATLTDPDLNVRLTAATALEALGPAAKPAIPALAKAIRGGDVEVRLASMYALMSIGIGADQVATVVPALIECLGSPDPRVVMTACDVLAKVGPPAAEALPSLRRLIGHDDPEVRQRASEAILSILRE